VDLKRKEERKREEKRRERRREGSTIIVCTVELAFGARV
jgi:hypothetical protein